MAPEYSKVLIRSRLTSTFTRGERECKRNWRCVRRSPSVNNVLLGALCERKEIATGNKLL